MNPSDAGTIKNKRILIISSIFPPDSRTGAEMSAYNFAHWLKKQGNEVAVLTTAKAPDEVLSGEEVDGLPMWKVWMPRLYPIIYFFKAQFWKKPIWHLQDYIDPRNRKIVGSVIDDFKPNLISVHIIQGIGYNSLIEIGKRNIPVIMFLPDLGLACFRMAMFRNGCDCPKQCALCKLTSAYKSHCVKQVPRIGFMSPSRANLEKLAQFFPIKKHLNTSIMNPNKYPAATVGRTTSDCVRFLYVGRLHITKGVDILLKAARELAATRDFTLTIVGSGPKEAELRNEYGNLPWCKFTGFISQQEISNLMVNSDLLCIPSIWSENFPGVVVHALGLGLPVMGSDKGGIPELVENGKNGTLIPAGDCNAWKSALADAIDNPAKLKNWSKNALNNASKFDQDNIGRQLLNFISEIEKSANLTA
ncbi:MAG: glycosyltransferase [Alphaproteobacteria bacterium]|nr:glycosyltransferase [Alphaproteobacteria bacterium]